MKTYFASILRKIGLWPFVLPLGLTIVLWSLIACGIFMPGKMTMEIAAVLITAVFFLTSAIKYARSKHAFFLWSSVMLLLIMCREIHFKGSTVAIYLGMLILLWYAVFKYHILSDYLSNPLIIKLLVAGFFVYFISQTIDQRWWKFIPAEEIVHVSLEETLEVLGHCVIGATLVSQRMYAPIDKTTAPSE